VAQLAGSPCGQQKQLPAVFLHHHLSPAGISSLQLFLSQFNLFYKGVFYYLLLKGSFSYIVPGNGQERRDGFITDCLNNCLLKKRENPDYIQRQSGYRTSLTHNFPWQTWEGGRCHPREIYVKTEVGISIFLLNPVFLAKIDILSEKGLYYTYLY
jgi:hypothetical protein